MNCPVTALAAGAATTCTAAYTVTQADADAGSVTNSAVASGTAPDRSPITSAPSQAVVSVTAAPALALVKTARVVDNNNNGTNDLGDSIFWSFAVTNTGTVTLATPTVQDPTAGTVSCPSGALAPGASATCTAVLAHTIDQRDVTAGFVANTATASASAPCSPALLAGGLIAAATGCATVTSAPSSTHTAVSGESALTLTKTSTAIDTNGDGRTDEGDHIHWTITVDNVGTNVATQLAVSDPSAGPASCPSTTLDPGQSMICTVADHLVTAADVASGQITNVATVHGLGVRGLDLRGQASAQLKTSSSGQGGHGGTGGTGGSGGNGGSGGTSGNGGTGGSGGSGGSGGTTHGHRTGLPFTGAEYIGTGLILGFGLILLGFALFLAGRRRRHG